MFFLRRLMERKSFSILIILIDRWQVLSYLIRMPLLNQANHAIWQKSWSTSIVFTAFPWILEVNGSKEEKRAFPFSFSTSKLLRRLGFEISRKRHGLLLQSRKMTKRWRQSSHKNLLKLLRNRVFIKSKSASANQREERAGGWMIVIKHFLIITFEVACLTKSNAMCWIIIPALFSLVVYVFSLSKSYNNERFFVQANLSNLTPHS